MDYHSFNDSWWGFAVSLGAQLAVTTAGVYLGVKWERRNQISAELFRINLLIEDVIKIETQLTTTMKELGEIPNGGVNTFAMFPTLDAGSLTHNLPSQRELVSSSTWEKLENLRNIITSILPGPTDIISIGHLADAVIEEVRKAEEALKIERAKLSKK
jgi:hypothetical protein